MADDTTRQRPSIGDMASSSIEQDFWYFNNHVVGAISDIAQDEERPIVDAHVLSSDKRATKAFQMGFGVNNEGYSFLTVVDTSVVPVASPLGERALRNIDTKPERGATVFGLSQFLGRLTLQPEFPHIHIPTITLTKESDGISVTATRSGNVSVIRRGAKKLNNELEGFGLDNAAGTIGRRVSELVTMISSGLQKIEGLGPLSIRGTVHTPLRSGEAYKNVAILAAIATGEHEDLFNLARMSKSERAIVHRIKGFIDPAVRNPNQRRLGEVLDFLDDDFNETHVGLIGIVLPGLIPDELMTDDVDVRQVALGITEKVWQSYSQQQEQTKPSAKPSRHPIPIKIGEIDLEAVFAAIDHFDFGEFEG